jgi:hypothetical protein
MGRETPYREGREAARFREREEWDSFVPVGVNTR